MRMTKGKDDALNIEWKNGMSPAGKHRGSCTPADGNPRAHQTGSAAMIVYNASSNAARKNRMKAIAQAAGG
jgi:hypothetical protein